MKLKIMMFFTLTTLFITGAAFAMPQLGERAPFPEPAAMLFVGIGLICIASLGRRMLAGRS